MVDEMRDQILHQNKIKGVEKAKKVFLEHYAKTGRVHESADVIHRSASQIRNWKERDPKFLAAYKEAEERFLEKIEAEIDRRAVEGVREDVFNRKGEKTGTVTKFSDVLIMFRAKALAPNKYRERIEQTGPNGGALQSEIKVNVIDPNTAENLKKLES